MNIREQAEAIGLAVMFGQLAVFVKKTVNTAGQEFFSVDLLGAEGSPVQFRLSGLINSTPESQVRECKSGSKQRCVLAGHTSFEWPKTAAPAPAPAAAPSPALTLVAQPAAPAPAPRKQSKQAKQEAVEVSTDIPF